MSSINYPIDSQNAATSSSNNQSIQHNPNLSPTSKRCIAIAHQTINNPDTKFSYKDLTLIRAHKRELKNEIQTLKNRENETTKKILNAVKHTFQKAEGTSKLDLARAEYKAVKEAYDQIVENNPSVRQAKKILTLLNNTNSQLSKAGDLWQNVDSEFKNKFAKHAEYFKPLGNLHALLGPKTDANFKQKTIFLERLVDGLEQVRCSEALKQRPISWLHGTRSPALAVMLATDKIMYSTGQLLEHKIVPLTGELGIGIKEDGINQTHISGTSVSRLGVKTSIKYASEFKANKENEWNQVSISHINKIINRTELTLEKDPNLKDRFADGTKFDWLQIGLYVERLKVIDPTFSDHISEVKDHIKTLIKEKQNQPEQQKIVEFLQDLLDKCDSPPFIEPTQSIRESVADSFPIVLAATNVKGRLIDETLDEYLVKDSVLLENISVAFTTAENTERLRDIVKEAKLNIEVMNFNALSAIAIDSPETGASST